MFTMPQLNPLCRFIGSYENLSSLDPKKLQNGDIIIRSDDNSQYVWVDNKYIKIGDGDFEQKSYHPQICSCCGAPVKGGRCEYCGTEYF